MLHSPSSIPESHKANSSLRKMNKEEQILYTRLSSIPVPLLNPPIFSSDIKSEHLDTTICFHTLMGYLISFHYHIFYQFKNQLSLDSIFHRQKEKNQSQTTKNKHRLHESVPIKCKNSRLLLK